MKNYFLFTLFIFFTVSTYSQKFSFARMKERSSLLAKLYKAEVKVQGDKRNGYEQVLHENKVDEITYVGIAEEFLSMDSETEQLLLGNVFPLKYVARDGSNRILTFPEGYAYRDGVYNRLKSTRITNTYGSKSQKVSGIYNFDTEYGPALVVEYLSLNDRSFHGLILKSDWGRIITKVKNRELGVFTDSRDDQLYTWTKIGDLVWMGQNLRYKLEEHPAMERYTGFTFINGRFYNFDQALLMCPDGWHLPTDEEWKELELKVGVWPRDINVSGSEFSREGIDTLPGRELQFSDDLMFYAKIGGSVSKTRRGSYNDYSLYSFNNQGYYWSSTKTDEVSARYRIVGAEFNGVVRDEVGTQNYMSCRCVQDNGMEVLFERHPSLKTISDKIDAAPQLAQNYFDRAVELLLIGEANKSMNDIEKSIKLDPNNQEQKLFKAQILYLYGLSFFQDDLIETLESYLSAVNNNPFAYYMLSKIVLYDVEPGLFVVSRDEARRKKSLDLITKALKLDPKNPQLLQFRAKLMVVMGDYYNAVLALKKAIESDPNNGELYYLLAKMKLKNFDKKNSSSIQKWCTAMTGVCYKVTPSQITQVCKDFKKAIQLGAEVNPDYMTICSELKQAETLKKHTPAIHIGPRGGRYTISKSGNKVYLPRTGR